MENGVWDDTKDQHRDDRAPKRMAFNFPKRMKPIERVSQRDTTNANPRASIKMSTQLS